MSLCDKCYDPGHCCRMLNLFNPEADGQLSFWTDEGEDGIIRQVEAMNLPFRPAIRGQEYVDEETGRTYAVIWFYCPHLTDAGRCGIYDQRPDLCRRFEPASSPLCCHHNGAEGVDLIEGLP